MRNVYTVDMLINDMFSKKTEYKYIFLKENIYHNNLSLYGHNLRDSHNSHCTPLHNYIHITRLYILKKIINCMIDLTLPCIHVYR